MALLKRCNSIPKTGKGGGIAGPDATTPEETITNEAIPAGPLPKTGGVDPMFLYGAGLLLVGGGLFLRRRDKSSKSEK